VECFACTGCGAVPDVITDGRAQIAVVRHAADCATLAAQVQTRWPLHPASLPDTPAQIPFSRLAGHRHALLVWKQQRR
jgi:hypothetical protein